MRGTMDLFRQESSTTRSRSAELRERPRTSQRAFLIVDESATIRFTTAGVLAKLGHGGDAVHVAETPDESLELFDALDPDVVLIELDADSGDGLAVALDMLERKPIVKLIVLTSRGRDCARVQRAVRAGAFAVIEKPLRHEKIRTVLQEIEMEDGGIERMR